MSKIQAKIEYNKLREKNFKFTVSSKDISEPYKRIREELVNIYNDLKKDYSTYNIDLRFGLALYEVLNKEFNLNNDMVIASNIDFWISLSINIFPDLVYDRWGDSVNRFYNHNKRIWLLSLWWYIHISWQGSMDETFKILEGNTTDTIVQLIERVGIGYDLNLTRELMRGIKRHKSNSKVFRTVMVLNTIYFHTIEPEFFKGGYEGYVDMLFNKATT